MKGLFINSPPALCSIYESGVMAFKALSLSKKYDLDYTDCEVPLDSYDFVVVNWHCTVCFWPRQDYLAPLKAKGKTFCLVTEMFPDNPIPSTPDIFDHYLVLDPTMKETEKFHAFPRPIEIVEDLPDILEKEIGKPVIGSFGFPTRGKRWDLIVEEVQKDFDSALIRFNIPQNTFPDTSINIHDIKRKCYDKINKHDITLEFSHEDMSKEELIKWCAQNTINVFFYWRDLSGLAAVTDQAVSAKRPILCSNDKTFRHVNQYCLPYPERGIREAIQQNKDATMLLWLQWQPINFCEKFEQMV